MADNASSNDTLLDALAKRCAENGIPFNAKQARMRCMPHTIHLAACQVRSFCGDVQSLTQSIQLLEGIGAIKKDQKGRRANYQEDVAVPLTDDALADAEGLEDDGNDEEDVQDSQGPEAVLRAVPKVCVLLVLLAVH